jgi:hypothetical protein
VSEDGCDRVWMPDEHRRVQFGECIFDVEYNLENDILKYELQSGTVYTCDGTLEVKPVDILNVPMEDILRYVVAKFPPPPPSFAIRNLTKQTIKELLISHDGKAFVRLKLAKDGIPSGETARVNKPETLKYCDQFIKLILGNGDEVAPVKFDLCDLEDVIELTTGD